MSTARSPRCTRHSGSGHGARWEHIAGNQACLAHFLRDFEDCAESYPDAVWPVQAQRALRGMTRAWHAAVEQCLPAIPADTLKPLDHEFRHAVLAGLASVPRVPGPKNSTKQKPGRELLEFCRDRRDDVLRSTATSTRPASTARMQWTSFTTSCSASPGGRQHRHSPRNGDHHPVPPITARERPDAYIYLVAVFTQRG
jgi:Transposase IS66 family